MTTELSPSRKVLKRELPTLVKAEGVLIEERAGVKLWHHKDILDETRGGALMLRVNRAYVEYPSTFKQAGTFYPMSLKDSAKSTFDSIVKRIEEGTLDKGWYSFAHAREANRPTGA